ncbi:hypothetical protein C8J56DRAFT_883447 [Mycena floridula]|nr:hypothetical protein C8J56DRAFT_883447 [Mycena floridula]
MLRRDTNITRKQMTWSILHINALKSWEICQLQAREIGDMFLELNIIIEQALCNILIGNLPYASVLLKESEVLLQNLGLENSSACAIDICQHRAILHAKRTEPLQAREMHIIPADTKFYRRMHILTTSIIFDIHVPSVSQDSVHRELITLPHSQHDWEQMSVELAWGSYYFYRLKDYALLQECWTRSLGLDGFTWHHRANWMQLLGDAAMLQDHIVRAEQHFICLLAYSASWSKSIETLDAPRRLGDVYLVRDGDEKTAFSLFETALEAYTVRDIHCSRAECMARLADILIGRGQVKQAKEYIVQAIPLFKRSLQEEQVHSSISVTIDIF